MILAGAALVYQVFIEWLESLSLLMTRS